MRNDGEAGCERCVRESSAGTIGVGIGIEGTTVSLSDQRLGMYRAALQYAGAGVDPDADSDSDPEGRGGATERPNSALHWTRGKTRARERRAGTD